MNYPKYCQIPLCENNRGIKDDRCTIFTSRHPDTIKQWKEALNNLGLACNGVGQLKICMLHFHPDDILEGKPRRLRSGAIPSLRSRPMPSHNQLAPDDTQTIHEPKIELIEHIKTEPMDLDVNAKPLTPRFTYGNRKRGQLTKTLSTIPVVSSQIEQKQLIIKIEEPDESEAHLVTIARIENQNPIQQTSQSGCTRCFDLKLKETQLAADTDEFQQKCQLLRAENTKLRAEVQRYVSKAFRLGQLICTKRCELCSAMVVAHQLREHLCAGLSAITCEYCANATFTSTMALREHLASGVHMKMKFYKCSKCTLGFRMRKLLEIHENLNHGHLPKVETDTMYKCSKCNESSEQPLKIVRHFERSHTPEPKPPKGPFFECYLCKCQLERHFAVRKHLKQHVAARDTKCVICSERFTSNELMEWHICGGNDAERSQISCEYCDQSFQSVVKCVQHLEIAHPDRTMYKCRKCSASKCYGMKLLKNLHEKYHLHTAKTFQCDICSRKFALKFQIRTHMQIHLNDVSSYLSFLCSECGKRYRSKRTLRIHQLTHAEPTIQCPDCPAKFRLESSMKMHYEIHQNFKFKCNECNVTYPNQRVLRKHINRVHKKTVEIKKYICPFCDFKCAKSDKFKLHLRTHTHEKPFECEMCHKFYRYKGDLTKHMQTHVGDNIYQCDVCGQGFRYHLDFKRHSFKHYKEDREKFAAAQCSSAAVENEK